MAMSLFFFLVGRKFLEIKKKFENLKKNLSGNHDDDDNNNHCSCLNAIAPRIPFDRC